MTDPKNINDAFLKSLFDAMADAVYLLDSDTSNIVWCNRAGYDELGLRAEEVLNHSVLSLQKDVQGLPQWEEVKQVILSQTCFTFVGRHRHSNGGEIAVEVNTTHFEFEGTTYFLSVARNVNKRLALDNELRTRDDKIWFAINEASDGLWEWEINTDYVFFSPQLKKMLGYGPDEMRPHIETWVSNVHPDDLPLVKSVLDQHLQGYRANYEAKYRLRNRNGHYLWVHDQGKVCQRDAAGEATHVVGMVRNITDQKALEEQLEALAAFDLLTELPNRREGEKKALLLLEQAKQAKQPLCLAVLDVDHFKKINDLHGHLKGDEVLIFCANLIRNTIRKADQVYRWGGEEFVILMPNTTVEESRTLCETLHRVFAEANWSSLAIDPVTICLGVSCCSEKQPEKSNFTELFKSADLATYRAKSAGRNQTIWVD